MTDSTNKNLLQTENFLLTRKVEILESLNAEYTTKYKEVELRLTVQHKQKEDEYITKIEQLQQLINKQKKGMRSLQIDSLSKQLTKSKSFDDENAKYKKKIKSLRQDINEKQQKIKELQFRVYELVTSSKQKEKERVRRSDAKKMQIASIVCELEQYRSLEIVQSRDESLLKLQHTSKTKSDSSNIEKKNTDTALTEPTMPQQSTLSPQIYNFYSTTSVRTELYDGDSTEAEFTQQESDRAINTEFKQAPTTPIIDENIETEVSGSKQIRKPQEYRTQQCKLVLKQLPCFVKTHFWMNLYIEKKGEIIVTFLNRTCCVNMLLEMLKLSDTLKGVFVNNIVKMYAADEDFEMDENSCALAADLIISELGIMNACIRCNEVNPEETGFDVNLEDHKSKLLHLQQSETKPIEIYTTDITITYNDGSGDIVPDPTTLTPDLSEFDEHTRGGVCCNLCIVL